MFKIALDAGHGLYTKGKQTPDGIKEWTLNDKVRDKVVELLSGYDIEIIHTDNNEGATDESLSQRKNTYLSADVSAAVSIHHNAYTSTWNNATGVEVYVDKKATDKDMRLAECIYEKLVEYTGLKGRGIKKADFTVINQNKVPAVLVEGGFMDGAEDYKVITSEAGQVSYAKAIADGIVEFLGLQKKVLAQTVAAAPKLDKVLKWQLAAIADGFKFQKYGADGKWGKECESVAKKAICKKRLTYKYKNLTKIVQKAVGVKADGKFGKDTKAAVIKWQKLMGLYADGAVGIETWKKILGV